MLAEMRCAVHRTISSELVFCALLLRKKFPRIGMSPKPGNLLYKIGHPIIHQSRDHKTLAVLQFKFGLRFARAQRGHGEAGDGERIGEIESADLRRHFQMDVAVGHDHGGKFQLHSEFLERDGDRGKTLPGLDDGEGKFSAGQKAGFLAVYRDQIGLGQDLQQVLLLQGLDHRANS